MRIFILLVYKIFALILDVLNKFFNVPRLRHLREVVDVIVEDMSGYTSSTTPEARDGYRFRPFEVKRIKHRSNNSTGHEKIRPHARSGHRVACSDSALYCFGGFNPNMASVNRDDDDASSLFQELWKYDLMKNEWTLIMDPSNDLPQELASNAMILHGDTLILFGGTGFPFGVNCSNRLYICQPAKKPKELTEIAVKGDLPPAQYGQAILYHDGFLYTIGGTEGFDYTCDVYRLNVASKMWECAYTCRQDVRDDPPGRYRHELAFDDDKIYIIGGGTSESAFSLSSIPTYDLKRNVWTYTETKPDPNLPRPGVPAARKCHSCVQYQTDNGMEVVVAGGYDGRSYYKDVWKLNLSTFEWRLMQKSALPYPIFFHDAGASSAGCMYIFGGIKFSFNNNIRTNIVYKAWMTIPKLSEICWEALQHYCPSMVRKSKSNLLEAGIPLQFVQRIHET